MNRSSDRNDVLRRDGAENTKRYYQKDFWSKANLKFSEPHYRLEKGVRLIKKAAKGQQCTLLDVGCGPATLMHMLPPNVKYYGVDIAIQEPAPNLIEADIIKTPIGFNDLQFDIVHAQGIFEYVGDFQSQKFKEISTILKRDGVFIVSYWNFNHRHPQQYSVHSNVQTITEFCEDLSRYFKIDRLFPASHSLHQHWPGRRISKAINMHVNRNIPVISSKLAVDYFVCCSPRHSA